MSESDTLFNDRRCAAVQIMLSNDPSYDNRIIASTLKCKSGLPRITGTWPGWWKQIFRLWLWSLVWFQVRATSYHLTSSKSAWKSTPKCTWMCWRVWWSPGAIIWARADPGCGNRTRRWPTSPKRPRLGFRRSATTLYPSLTYLCQTELLEIELFWHVNCISCQTELFKIELIICIKMDLALNNLQWLICHKTQTTNQSTSFDSLQPFFSISHY